MMATSHALPDNKSPDYPPLGFNHFPDFRQMFQANLPALKRAFPACRTHERPPGNWHLHENGKQA